MYSPVNLLHNLRTPFLKNTSEETLLDRLTKFIVYFGLHESSLHFLEKDQIDKAYWKKINFPNEDI